MFYCFLLITICVAILLGFSLHGIYTDYIKKDK